MLKCMLFLLLVVSSLGTCEESLSVADIQPRPSHSFFVSPHMYGLDYKEDVPAPQKSTERGVLAGFGIGYENQSLLGSDNLVQLKVDYSVGRLTYDGTFWSGKPAPVGNGNHSIFNVEALAGWGLYD